MVSNADPKRTFLGMVEASELEPAFAEAVRGLDYRGTMGRVHIAVDRLPPFVGFGSGEQPPHRSLTVVGASLEAFERAWVALKAGEIVEEPAVEMTIQSVTDPSLAPAGSHIITTGIQQLPFELAEGTWDDARETLARRAIDQIERYAPGFESSIVGTRVITPLDLERDWAPDRREPVPRRDERRSAVRRAAAARLRPLSRADRGSLLVRRRRPSRRRGHGGARPQRRPRGARGSRSAVRRAPPDLAGAREGNAYDRLGRLMERPRLQRATTTLARQRWLRPVFDRAGRSK